MNINSKTLGNKERIEKKLNETRYEIGCYNQLIDSLNIKNISKVLAELGMYDHVDVPVTLARKKYIVEVSYVDNEVDFDILTKAEYENRYGKMEE